MFSMSVIEISTSDIVFLTSDIEISRSDIDFGVADSPCLWWKCLVSWKKFLSLSDNNLF